MLGSVSDLQSETMRRNSYTKHTKAPNTRESVDPASLDSSSAEAAVPSDSIAARMRLNCEKKKLPPDDGSQHWRDMYRAAMLESDPTKISERVVSAAEAMIQRQTELQGNRSKSIEERWEIEEAMLALKYWQNFNAKYRNLF
jgi:hypothetical protein